MAKNIILTENKLRRLVREAIMNCINEAGPHAGESYFTANSDGSYKDYFKGRESDYLTKHSSRNGVYGEITRHCNQTGVSYRDAMGKLYNLVKKYLAEGKFGENQVVLETINAFNRLISNLYTSYISNVKRGVTEAGGWKGLFKKGNPETTNKYGVKVGQWASDLQNMLREYINNKYIHGQKSVAATEAFIEYLSVVSNPSAAGKAILKLKKLLIAAGLAALFTTSFSGGDSLNGVSAVPVTPNKMEMVAQNNVNVVAFDVSDSRLSTESIQALKSLKPGNYTITYYNIKNSNDKVTNEDKVLEQQRKEEIKKVVSQLNGVNADIVWGGMGNGQIVITPSNAM